MSGVMAGAPVGVQVVGGGVGVPVTAGLGAREHLYTVAGAGNRPSSPREGGRNCAKGLRRNAWTLFCCGIRVCQDSRIFGRLWASRGLFWVKTVFLGQEGH